MIQEKMVQGKAWMFWTLAIVATTVAVALSQDCSYVWEEVTEMGTVQSSGTVGYRFENATCRKLWFPDAEGRYKGRRLLGTMQNVDLFHNYQSHCAPGQVPTVASMLGSSFGRSRWENQECVEGT
jgi:hypothetical protein